MSRDGRAATQPSYERDDGVRESAVALLDLCRAVRLAPSSSTVPLHARGPASPVPAPPGRHPARSAQILSPRGRRAQARPSEHGVQKCSKSSPPLGFSGEQARTSLRRSPNARPFGLRQSFARPPASPICRAAHLFVTVPYRDLVQRAAAARAVTAHRQLDYVSAAVREP